MGVGQRVKGEGNRELYIAPNGVHSNALQNGVSPVTNMLLLYAKLASQPLQPPALMGLIVWIASLQLGRWAAFLHLLCCVPNNHCLGYHPLYHLISLACGWSQPSPIILSSPPLLLIDLASLHQCWLMWQIFSVLVSYSQICFWCEDVKASQGYQGGQCGTISR